MFAVMLIFPVAMIGLIGLNVWDFDRDLIDISNGKVQVVNYFFGIKRERAVSISDIANIEKLDSRSFKLLIHGRGLKYHSYYYVTDSKNKYLFKVFAYPASQRALTDATGISVEN